jgi:hypothetical protein
MTMENPRVVSAAPFRIAPSHVTWRKHDSTGRKLPMFGRVVDKRSVAFPHHFWYITDTSKEEEQY